MPRSPSRECASQRSSLRRPRQLAGRASARRKSAREIPRAFKGRTLDDAFRRYEKGVSVDKRGTRHEVLHMGAIGRYEIAGVPLGEMKLPDITSDILGRWRDQRLTVDKVKARPSIATSTCSPTCLRLQQRNGSGSSSRQPPTYDARLTRPRAIDCTRRTRSNESALHSDLTKRRPRWPPRDISA